MIKNPNASLAGSSTSSIDDILKLTNPAVPGTSGTSGVRGLFGSILGGLGNLVFPGLGTAIGGAVGGAIGGAGLGAAMPTLGSETTQYLMLQRQIEQESLAFETASTVMKVRNDAATHAIQNMKSETPMTWNVNPSREEIGFLMETSLIYRDSGRLTEAREVLTGLRALLPQNEAVVVFLGTVSFQQGDFEGAARHYKQALEFNPRSAYAYAHWGREIFRKDKEQAATYLREAIKLDPRGVYGAFARSLLEFSAVVQYKETV